MEPTPPRNVAIVPTSDYNGTRARLDQSRFEGASTAASTTAAIASGTRRLEFTLPTAEPRTGDVFTLGTGGVRAMYSEGANRRWIAASGTLTIRSDEATFVDAALADATFVPYGTGAKGGFTGSSGSLILGYGIDEGPGAVTLLREGEAETNSVLESFGESAGSGYSDSTGLFLVVADRTAAGWTRELALALPKATEIGASGSFGDAGLPSSLTYTEERGSALRTWHATGGSWRLVSRSRSNIEVAITGVVMVPNPIHTASTARGAIRFDGTLKR